MRIASFVLTAIFVLGAAVQLNDPDPALWVAAYLVGAGLSLHAAIGGRAFVPNAIAALVYAGWFASLAASLPGAPGEAFTSFRMQASSHEEPREAVGLALLAIWSIVLAVQARRAARDDED